MIISANKWEHDVQAYLNVCGITSATPRKQIRDFAAGVNDLGLWNSMVCWPLRSSQNAGTGTTAFSLGGLGAYNGTLTNGPTWGASGITNSVNGYMLSSVPFFTSHSLIAVYSQTSTSGLQTPIIAGDATDSLSTDRRSNFRTDNNTFLFNGITYVNYGFGPSSLNAFRMAGIGVISQGTLLGYNNSTTTTVSSSAANISGGSPLSNVSLLSGSSSKAAGQYLVGTMAFGMVLNSQISSSNYSSMYNLYKTTIGTGLGLP